MKRITLCIGLLVITITPDKTLTKSTPKELVPLLNIATLRKAIKKSSLKNKAIVFKQAIGETGWLKSKICLQNHNLFAMRFHKGLPIAKANGYAVYRNWLESLKDYEIWQRLNYKNPKENYYSFLERIGYAEDTSYTKFLTSINISKSWY